MLVSDLLAEFNDLDLRDFELNSEILKTQVKGITHDNRDVKKGFIFAALPGQNVHGIKFAQAAIEAGALFVLTDSEGAAEFAGPCLVTKNPRRDMGLIARAIYGNTQSRLLSVGVTGTNGKTTTSTMITAMLHELQRKPVLIGTIGIKFADKLLPAKRTTPESTELHQTLREAETAGCDSLVMEVSSHALELDRVVGMNYDVAIFTGLTQDHLDFHDTMDAYFFAKAKLFTAEFAKFAVINVDDSWGQKLARIVDIPSVTYGLSQTADWYAKDVSIALNGKTTFTAVGPDSSHPIELSMPGSFNIANALAAIAAINALTLDIESSFPALSKVQVAGRVERVEQGQPFVVLVDYAHTPDAVERALAVARTCATGKVIAVLGCGGDRDASKRPLMGIAAAANSDIFVITDDNPRSEEPAVIRAAIRAGVESSTFAAKVKVSEIGDRSAAITSAIALAGSGDCVIIMGKGHETGQEISGVVYPFSDVEVARTALAESGWSQNG